MEKITLQAAAVYALSLAAALGMASYYFTFAIPPAIISALLSSVLYMIIFIRNRRPVDFVISITALIAAIFAFLLFAGII